MGISFIGSNSTKLNTTGSTGLQTGSKGTKAEANDIVGRNINYFTAHPPEVFFIQDQNNSLHSYLLNFVPKNEDVEFGQDKIWTGKLYEWNLSGDTIHVQDIEKSSLKERYALKQDRTDANEILHLNNTKNLTLNDKKLGRTIWDALLDAFSDFIGWVGSVFGWSNHYNASANGDINGGWRLNISFTWLTGNSGGGNNNTGGGGYTGAGGPVYAAYIEGYGDPFNGNWSMYPDATYGSGPNVNTSYDPSTLYLFQSFPSLTPEQKEYLLNNPAISGYIKDYLDNDTRPRIVIPGS